MGKREDKKRIKQMRSEIEAEIKERLKGSAWKTKHARPFQSIGDNFYESNLSCKIRIINDAPSITAFAGFAAKPLAIDPLYWDIAELSENKKEPLSFRAWAAFKTRPATFHSRTIATDIHQTDDVITAYLNWLDIECPKIQSRMEAQKFSELYLSLQKNDHPDASYATTLICAYLTEGQKEKALSIAQSFAPTEFKNLYHGGNPDHRVNFYELAILHITGELPTQT